MSATDALTDLRQAQKRTEETIQLAIAQRRSTDCQFDGNNSVRWYDLTAPPGTFTEGDPDVPTP